MMLIRSALSHPSFTWSEFHRRGPWLTRVALAHAALFLVLLLLMMFDDRQLTGVNIWLKPAKFALSISIYLLTMAWLIGELKWPRSLILVVSFMIMATMSLEQFLITLQAARGTTSHYNAATSFDARVFSLMGAGVGTNSSGAGLVLLMFLFHRSGKLVAYWWGICAGLVLFLAGSLQGFVMISNLGHTVGAPDGGPGIPLLAWSSVAGDLRIAHFVGIHALQVLPLIGLLLDRTISSAVTRRLLILVVVLAYGLLGLKVHQIALAGQPLLG